MNNQKRTEFPKLDETQVQRLAELAARIDDARPGEWEEELKEFNQLAKTSLEFNEFQGIYGGMDHDEWVRCVLSEKYAHEISDLTYGEMLELIQNVKNGHGTEEETFYWIKLLEKNLNPRISDLIYWPDEYFGDDDHSREMTPQEILDEALKTKE